MIFWLQLWSAVSGFVAAVLWFCSASAKAPAMTWAELDNIPGLLSRASRLNKWAAAVTSLSMLLSAVAALLPAIVSIDGKVIS
jgi:hypothetical protein